MTSLVNTILKRLLGLTYVEGSSGSWNYRKYADGRYECWYTYHSTNVAFPSVLHNNSYASNPINVPFPITFKSINNVLCSGFTSNLGYIDVSYGVSTGIAIYFINSSSDTGTAHGEVRVFGWWK